MSRSKRNSAAAALPCGKAKAASALSQTPTNLPQVPNIRSRASRGGGGFAFGEDTQAAKLSISFFQQFVSWNLRNLLQRPAQSYAKIGSNRIIVRCAPPSASEMIWST